MKYLFISAFGESVALGIRLKYEGNQVRVYIQDPNYQDVGDGLIEKVKTWQPSLHWADIIFVDDVEQGTDGGRFQGGKLCEGLRRMVRVPVIGGTVFGDKLENDRMAGQDVFEKAGMDIMPMKEFHSFKQARAFVEKQGGAWALKHCEQAPRDMTNVFWTPDEMITFIDWLDKVWAKATKNLPIHFVLQEAVKGVEIAVTGFVAGGQVVPGTVYLNRETKKTMAGNHGPSSGQVGEIGRFLDDPKLYEKTLARVAPMLGKDYLTWFDVNLIVTKDKLVPLEATSRPGYPTVHTFVEGLEMDLGDFLANVTSSAPKPVKHCNQWLCNLVVPCGTFPFEDKEINRRSLILGMDAVEPEHLWPCEVRMEKGELLGAGMMGYTCIVTSRGKTIEEAAAAAYKRADKIHIIPYDKVRDDIGDKDVGEFKKLAEWGWLA